MSRSAHTSAIFSRSWVRSFEASARASSDVATTWSTNCWRVLVMASTICLAALRSFAAARSRRAFSSSASSRSVRSLHRSSMAVMRALQWACMEATASTLTARPL